MGDRASSADEAARLLPSVGPRAQHRERPRRAITSCALVAICSAALLAPLLGATAAGALVSIGEGGNSTGIAYEGSFHSLIYRWQTYGGQGWNRELVASQGSTYSSPAIGEGNGATAIVAEGTHNSIDFYWQNYGSSNWDPEQVDADGSAYSPPAIAEGNDSDLIAVEGPHNSLDFYWQSYGSSGWDEEVVADSGAAYAAPSLTDDNDAGTTDIAVQGPDHSLSDWEQCYSCGASLDQWQRLPVAGDGTTYSAPAAINYGGADYVEIAWQGPQQRLQYAWGAGGYFSVESVAGPGNASSAPAINIGGNSTAIAVEAPGHNLDFYWQTIGGQTWSSQVAGQQSAFSAPSIGEGNGYTSIAAEGPAHSLLFYFQQYGSSGWAQQFAAPTGTTYA